MIDVVFGVSPAGICGMNELAKFLDGMKRAEEIADWHPHRATSDSKGASYLVQFDNDGDAMRAKAKWVPV